MPVRYVAQPGVSAEQTTGLLYHGQSFPPTEVVGRSLAMERLDSYITATQAARYQTLADIGLTVSPEPYLDFGVQSFCQHAFRNVQVRAQLDVTVTVVDAGGIEAEITVIRKDFGVTALVTGQTLNLKVELFPLRYGLITTKIVLRTELGVAAYQIRAFIKDNIYRLRPISLPTARAISIHTPLGSPLQIFDVFSMNSHLVILSDEKYPWSLSGNHTKQLFLATYVNSTEPGTVVVRTNHTNLYIPVRTHYFSVFPSKLTFGVVNTRKVRHKVNLLASNFDEYAVKIERILTDSRFVIPKLKSTEIPPSIANITAAEVTFTPHQEGYYAGSLRIYINTTAVPIVVPYAAFVIYDFITANMSELSFHLSDTSPKSISLSLHFPVPLHCLSLTPPRPLFTLTDFSRFRLLPPFVPKKVFSIVPKLPYEYAKTRFVSIETEAGVTNLPVSVEDGTILCRFGRNFEPCLFQNNVNLGEKREGEIHSFDLILENLGRLEKEISVTCNDKNSNFEAIAKEIATNKSLILHENGTCETTNIWKSFNHHQQLIIHFRIFITSKHTQVSFLLCSFYHNYEFTFKWKLFEIDVSPGKIHFEAVYSGPVEVVNVTIKHTNQLPLVLIGWKVDVPGVVFTPKLTVLVRGENVVVGEVRLVSTCRPSRGFEYSLEVSSMEFTVWKEYQKRCISRDFAGNLRLFFNISQVVTVEIEASITPPVLSPSTLPFGLSDPYKISQRFIHISNPTDTPVIIEPLLIQDFTETDREDIGVVVRNRTEMKLGESSQAFFLPPTLHMTYLLPGKSSFSFGPIQFSPYYSGYRSSYLLLRNNLTCLEPIRLSGEMVNSYLHFPLILDLSYVNSYCSVQAQTLTMTNLGSMPMLISDITLRSGLCAENGAVLDVCHSVYLLQPSQSFETKLYFRPGFQSNSIDLVVVTEAEKLQYPIRILLPQEPQEEPCSYFRWYAVALLETLCVGVTLSGLQEYVLSKGRKTVEVEKLPGEPDLSTTSPILKICKKKPKKQKKRKNTSPTQISSSENIEEVEVKKQEKRKVPPIILDSLPEKVESEGTCKKEAPLPVFADPTSNKSTIVGESMLEDEAYLDEYKQSGLFSGFSLPCEEELEA